MKPRPALPRGPYLVVGLARSGIAAALALRARGERVIGVDMGTPSGLDELAASGVELHPRQSGVDLLGDVHSVIKSPGVPANAPVIAHARSRGICVLGELELAWRLLPNEMVAVTGTNGKTTTVELIGHIHREAGLPVTVAGNIGVALSGLVDRIDEHVTIACEVSSFQLEDTSEFAPEAAVMLNLTPDHLDRHGTIDAYLLAKLRIFTHQDEGDVAVAPLGFQPEGLPGTARRVCFGHGLSPQLSEREGVIHWEGEPLLACKELRLRGAHNVENAMAAAAVCLARELPPDAVRAGLRSFTGVPHRLEDVACKGGVLFVNDSKATNVASTLVALEAMADARLPVRLILGGQGKAQDFTTLRAPAHSGCRAVYLIGEDGDTIEQAIRGGELELHTCGELDQAVARAASEAVAGEVVLLSPACASFDQFLDFEARGERFRELVLGL